MSFKQLLRKLEHNINEGQYNEDGDNIDLLPLYINPESNIVRVSEDAIDHIESLKKIITTLKGFDLSRNEVRVYLYLARFGAQKALNIAKSLEIHRTETYKLLNNLESKGLISRILERPLRFSASPLEKVLNNFIEDKRRNITQLEKKKEELINIWSNLPQEKDIEGHELEYTYQVLESKRQITIKLNDLMKNCDQNFFMVLKSDEISWLYSTLFFEDLMKKGLKKQFNVRLITNYSSLGDYLPEDLALQEAEIGLVKGWDIPSFFISDEKEVVLILDTKKDEFSGMWTNYKSMTKSYNLLFRLLWKAKINKIK